jgi:hypothetical protein
MTTFRDFFGNSGVASDSAQVLRLVTWNIVFKVAARKKYIIQFYHAETAVFATRCFLAAMVAWAVEALAGLWAWEDLVHAVGMTSGLATMTTSRETAVTCKLTATFRAESGEVIRLADLDLGVRVTRTA